jgi:hypothetical protein
LFLFLNFWYRALRGKDTGEISSLSGEELDLLQKTLFLVLDNLTSTVINKVLDVSSALSELILRGDLEEAQHKLTSPAIERPCWDSDCIRSNHRR